MTTPPTSPESEDDADSMSLGLKVRRSLARRFPKTRRAYNWSTARARHWAGRIVGGIRKIGSTVCWAHELLATVRRCRREPRLTVTVDVASFWEPLTGIGWYLYRLLENLADRDDVCVWLFPPTIVHSQDFADSAVPLPRGRSLHLMRYEVPSDRVLCSGAVIRTLRRLEPLLIAIHRSRVLFAPNFFLPRRFSLARSPLVATIHDLGFKEVPWTLRDETLAELSDSLERTFRAADRLITVSSAVKQELLRHGYPREARVHVVHHGPGHLDSVEEGSLPPELPSRFALHVGTLEPRKNITRLLESWRMLQDLIDAPPMLILCGRYGWKTQAIEQQVDNAQRQGWVRHLGYVADQELTALYREAAVMVFPSLYEGFGLPAVEAQRAGTPLVCSDLPVLREVAGDGALFVPVDRADRFAEAVVEVLTDDLLREDLIRKGHRRAGQLSWTRTAEETLRVWHLAAG